MFHERSGFPACLKKEAECPGKPDPLNVSTYLTFSLNPLKPRNKLNKE